MAEIRTAVNLLLAVGLVSCIIVACLIEAAMGVTCYRDDSLGDREGNVYQCNSKDLSRCCVQDGTKTCCMAEAEKNMMEQLKLWGAVAGFLVLIAILFVCCKYDIACCKSDLSLKERWNNFRHKGKNRDAHVIEKDEQIRGTYYDNPIGSFESTSNYYPPMRDSYPPMRDPYNFPPLPQDTTTTKDYNYTNQSYA